MHSKPDQRDLLLCLMYPPFEVFFFFFPEKTECKTKVYTFLPLWEQLQPHNVSITPSQKKKRKKKRKGGNLGVCVGPVSVKGQQPNPRSIVTLKASKGVCQGVGGLEGEPGLFNINLRLMRPR